jgi:hypothetical protein
LTPIYREWLVNAVLSVAYATISGLSLSGGNHRAGDLALLSLHLSFRDVEVLLAERGTIVSYKTIAG